MAQARKLRSIQGTGRKPGHKSSTARHQARTLKSATRMGLPWEDDEVARVAQGIAADETTLEIALAVGRSYYGVMGVRWATGFAMRHWNAIGSARKKVR